MRLLRRERLSEFYARFRDSEAALAAWASAVQAGEFQHFVDLKRTFGRADYVKPFVVFNIAGNKYRLVALISYTLRTIWVEQVLTHAEYDQGRWRRT